MYVSSGKVDMNPLQAVDVEPSNAFSAPAVGEDAVPLYANRNEVRSERVQSPIPINEPPT